MRVEITTRHCDLSEYLKQRVTSRMEKLLRFDDGLKDARVVVSFEKNRYRIEATVQANGGQLLSHGVEGTKRAAIEAVLDRLEAQVKKQRDRVVTTRKRATTRTRPEARAAKTAAPPAEEPAEPFEEDSDSDGIVGVDPGDPSAVMALAEAAASLRASRGEAIAFTNRSTRRAILLFKRRDGKLGMIEL